MDETDQPAPSARSRIPPPSRIGWIVGIALATLVPSLLVSQLAGEREARSTDVRDEVARAWGPEQTIVGPTLMLPVTTKDGRTRYLTLAPRALDVSRPKIVGRLSEKDHASRAGNKPMMALA